MKIKKIVIIIIAVFILIFALKYEKQDNYLLSNNEISLDIKNDRLFKKFNEDFPDAEVITAGKCDITNDNKEDLVIIYKISGKFFMRAVLNKENSIVYTDQVAAPVENQTIEFRNIDHKDEMEFVISGSKRGNIGYAIYRIVNDKAVDLFGEGMDSCC